MSKRSVVLTIVSLTALALLALGSPAFAKDGDVLVRGICTGKSASKLKLSEENGRIEVEFEVDQNKSGQKWRVKLKDNSEVVFRGTAATKGPSGSFSIERRITDRAGSDAVKGVARNKSTDERCTASATT